MRLVAALLGLMALSGVAHADKGLVVESHVGARPLEAATVLPPVLSELEQAGFQTALEASPGPLGTAARPGDASENDATDLRRLVDVGYNAWMEGDFRTAQEQLARAVGRFQAHPGLLAEDQTRRDLLYKALAGLALSYKRLGQANAARDAMGELVRSFPDRDFNRTTFGPEAHELFLKVQVDLGKAGRGSLKVTTDDEGVLLFLNSRFYGVGGIHDTALAPGRYQVYTQHGKQPGRAHWVDVQAGQETRLVIDWERDRSLHVGSDWFGFAFVDEAERTEQEKHQSLGVARLADASSVIVLSLRDRQGQRALVGTVYSTQAGTLERSASLLLAQGGTNQGNLRAFGRFLAGGAPAPRELVDVKDPSAGYVPTSGPSPPDAPPSAAGPYRVWKWVAVTTATLAAAGSVGLFVLDGQCTSDVDEGAACPTNYRTKTGAIALAATALVLGGTGVYLFVADVPATPQTASTAKAWGAGTAWSF